MNHLELSKIPVLSEFIEFFAGVPIFFAMSGFLIWWSIGRSKSYSEYLKKRFWRIYPELWVAVLIGLVVLLCLYHEPIDWAQFGLFALTQSTIFQFWTPDCLRGYGCGCPNGALWTIGIMIQYYFVAFFIYKVLHNSSVWKWILSILLCIIVSVITPYIVAQLPAIAGKLYNQTIIPHLWMFLFPAFVAEKKDIILPILQKYWWVFLGACILCGYLHVDIAAPYYGVLQTTLLFAAVTGFAYAVPQVNIKTDISYGIYIYHMTVVNALIVLGYTGNNWLYAVVLIVTCIFAYLSTKYVGEFSKRMKQKIAA